MDIDERVKRVRELRKKYPKMEMAERGGKLVDLILSSGGNNKDEARFKELEEILQKLEQNDVGNMENIEKIE